MGNAAQGYQEMMENLGWDEKLTLPRVGSHEPQSPVAKLGTWKPVVAISSSH